jgi:sigma-54-specific transcriptional regulator
MQSRKHVLAIRDARPKVVALQQGMKPSPHPMSTDKLLTFPESASMALSIRAKALLFHDPLSVALLEQVERIAPSDATVLVMGETGTGKELIARHIHNRSGRSGPFVAVNCGAFSEALIDAELFGHESGAFTGAAQARAGWFESANGGTLFLDEIGDLPLASQVKLLRVLQERQVVRLGSRRPIGLDVRLVAATNVELHKAVEAQHFRADLYYRLSVATVALPPLRDRQGDILPLARHFIGIYGGKLGFDRPARLSDEAEHALLAYSWPGNIRELENVVHYALIVCRDGVVRPGDFRFSPLAGHGGSRGPGWIAQEPSLPVAVEPPAQELPLACLQKALGAVIDQGGQPSLFQTIEELVVRHAFAHCHDNQVQTARLLGITRNTLRTLLKRYGMLGAAAALDTGFDELDGDAAETSPHAPAAYSFENC